jgi:hypothetical protein
MAMKAIDLVGKRFGRLTVLKRAYVEQQGHGSHAHWLCKCDCGNETVVDGSNLRRGTTKSCGCYQKERLVTHGETNSRLYGIWRTMKTRCYNQSYYQFDRYGGRGIAICDEWINDFQAFYDWSIANGYRDDLSIDRIDNDGNYEPSNCRWATAKEQSNNTRRNVCIEFNGESHTMAEWAEILGIRYATLYKRIVQRHWDLERAFAVYRLVEEEA